MIAFALSFLPAWLVSFGAQIIGGAGLVAILCSLLPMVPYRRTIQVAGTAAFCWAIYQYGIADAQAVHEAAELRQQVATLNATVADREQRLAEYRIIVEAGAAREAQAQRDMQALQSRKNDYDLSVATSAAANPAGVWRFDADRVERMCRLAPGACPAGGK